MRMRTKLTVLAGVVLLLGVGVVVLWPRSNQITESNCGRIKMGMSRTEVESILGGPPGVYGWRPMWPVREESREVIPRDKSVLNCVWVRWWGDEGAIDVFYDPSGRAMGVTWCRCEPIKLSPFVWLIWRAECQWHRWFPA
jgi:hypothetical protein